MFQSIGSSQFQTPSTTDPAMLVRLSRGQIQSSQDVIALRRHIGLTQKQFASAIGISVHTLRNWEQGRRSPEGPALALLRIAARHPAILSDQLEHAGPVAAEASVPLS